MTRCVLYLRASTDLQEDSTITQATLCREYAAAHGLTIIREYVDEDVSASKIPFERRPSGSRLLADVIATRRDFDAILVLSFDRAFRGSFNEVVTLALLDKHRCNVISVRDGYDRSTPHGNLLHGVLRELREFESKQLGMRIREHNKANAMQGKWPGGMAPLGLTYSTETGMVTANERAADVVTIFRIFVECNGNVSLAARTLNAQGIPTSKNSLWHPRTLFHMLRSRAYRQMLSMREETFDGSGIIEKILPDELLQQADSLLVRKREFKPRQHGTTRTYSGLLFCSRCGDMLNSNDSRPQEADPCRGWRCKSRKLGVCDAKRVSEKWLDWLVKEALVKLIENAPDTLASDMVDIEPLESKPAQYSTHERLEARRTAVLRQHELGLIDDGELIRRIGEIDAQIVPVNKPEMQPQHITAEQAQVLIRDAGEVWMDAPVEAKRQLLLILGARLIVNTGERPLWLEMSTTIGLGTVRVEGPLRKYAPGTR